MLLDKLFSRKSNILILRELSKSKKGISNSEISKRTGLSEMAVSKSIRKLQKSNIVKSEKVGNTKLSRLNKSVSYSDDIIDLFKWEEAVVDELLKKITVKLSEDYPSGKIIILFGSRARGEEELDSDFDIMILSDEDRSFNKSEFIEGFLVSVFHLSEKEFLKRLEEKDPLIVNVYSDGRVLKGVREYAKLIQ